MLRILSCTSDALVIVFIVIIFYSIILMGKPIFFMSWWLISISLILVSICKRVFLNMLVVLFGHLDTLVGDSEIYHQDYDTFYVYRHELCFSEFCDLNF